MNGDGASWWTDQSRLQTVQYRTDANLAARQSIYSYQQPLMDLPAVVLDLAALRGGETVADVGCGNAAYLAELGSRGHAGAVIGVDLSPGMLRAARNRAPSASLFAGDAGALPLRDNAVDLALAAHMLYHVPDPRDAVRELRRITRDEGQVLVVLNGRDHLRELREALTAALPAVGAVWRASAGERLDLNQGAELLAAEFRSVTRHDFISELQISQPGPVEDYVRSMATVQALSDPKTVVSAVSGLIQSRLRQTGTFKVRTHCGCLVCT
jgi:ubiquinone/menaquinone biosynthesis C-methylase UbiE